MRVALAAVVVAALTAVAVASAAIERGTATITKRSGARVVLQVEVASTQADRRKGLMGRRTLPAIVRSSSMKIMSSGISVFFIQNDWISRFGIRKSIP